jgi:ribose transport system permease protein
MFLLFTVLWFVLTQTRFGLHVYAVGGNEETTRLAGVNTHTTTLATYIISGLMVGLGGVIFMGRLNSAPAASDQGTGICIGGRVEFLCQA